MPYLPSKAEAVLLALEAQLATVSGVIVRRNTPVEAAMEVPAGGLIILRDGEPGEPEVVLSPVTYHYEHQAEVEIYVTGPRRLLDQQFDTLRQAVGLALFADRTLGGAVMWVDPVAAVAMDLPALSELPIKAASLPVRLVYVTSNPLN